MTKLNGVKNAIMQVTYFLNGPIFNLWFNYHIILYWEKSYEKFSHNLTLEVQIVWKILWGSNSKLYLGNYSASPQPTLHQIKSYYLFGTTIFLERHAEIYRCLLSKYCKNTVLEHQEMVQKIFLIPTRNVRWKTFKVRKIFGCIAGAYFS